MTDQVLIINYQSPTGAEISDPFWLRLEQEGVEEDIATVADAADVLDSLYDLEPCEDRRAERESSSEDLPQEEDEPTSEDLAMAAQAISYLGCDQEPDGSIQVTVRVIRSDSRHPYVLRITGGRVTAASTGQADVPITVQEDYQQHILVESARSVVLPYPVVSGFSARWQGPVVGEEGLTITPPPISRTGTTLHWPGTITGTIAVSYLTTYDRATVLVYGVDGGRGEATVRCFCHGLVEELEIEVPELADDLRHCPDVYWKAITDSKVTCYKTITRRNLCNCSKEEVSSETYDQIVPCPPGAPTRCQGAADRCMHLLGSETVIEYVECANDSDVPGRPGQRYAVASREFYKEKCCEYPSFKLPQCPEKIGLYKGGSPIKGGEAMYRRIYGKATVFVPVTPKGGICGEHITRQIIEAESCCDAVPELRWDDDNSPDYIAKNSSVVVRVLDGVPPFRWSLESSVDIWFAGGGTYQETDAREVAVVSGPDSCGTATITVVDACDTEVTGTLLGPSGRWTRVAVYAGLPPSELLHLGRADYIDYDNFARLRIGNTEYRQEIGYGIQESIHYVGGTTFAYCASLERSDFQRVVDGGPPLVPTCDSQYYNDPEGMWCRTGTCRGYNDHSVMDPPDGVSWPGQWPSDPSQPWPNPDFPAHVLTYSDKCTAIEFIQTKGYSTGVDVDCLLTYIKIDYGQVEIWEWSC